MKPAGGWCDMTETAQLSASDEQPGDEFGEVSISGEATRYSSVRHWRQWLRAPNRARRMFL